MTTPWRLLSGSTGATGAGSLREKLATELALSAPDYTSKRTPCASGRSLPQLMVQVCRRM
jgi:hypothetical protein